MPAPPSVALILVSHDGARWLPSVLQGIADQTVPVSRTVGVDTGSKDESAELISAVFDEVRRESGRVSYAQAVRLGLETLATTPAGGPPPEWIWLLHDDSNPAPDALERLLAAGSPDVSVVGPKLREWPSLRRLLEVGVTLTGTGRRETGLERGEYDQGQHDESHEVLAVNTAGMLVRREVLEQLGGFDEALPIYGNDIDFGWRAAAAGHRTVVAPDAVVFHVEAAHRGIRRTPMTGRHPHYQERRAALYTLLANSPGRQLPFLLLRLALVTLLRMIGFLLVRSPGEALDDLAALVSLYGRPGEIRSARRARAAQHSADPAAVRRLLPAWWLPYRQGLDFVSDLAAAVTNQAADVAERRRAAAAEHDPSSMAARRQATLDDEEEIADSGIVVRFFTNPVALLLAVFVVLALVAVREGFGAVSGGGLSPVPDSTGHWWGLIAEHWHPLGTGTDVPAPAYLAPLALLSWVLGTSGAVSAVLVLAVPVAAWGAWRFLRVSGRLVSPRGAPRWLLLWGTAVYALTPLTSGAWGGGRLGAVAAIALLPFAAHAALGFADPEADRRWRAGWRTGVLVALLTLCTPSAWPLTLLLAVVVLGAAAFVVPGRVRRRDVWGPPLLGVAVSPLLLLPWWLPALASGAGSSLLMDVGRVPTALPDGLQVLTGRIDDSAAPLWLGVALVALAVLALVPRATRVPVLVCWIVLALTGVVALALSLPTFELPAATERVGLSAVVALAQGALVTAVVLGGQGLSRAHLRTGVAVGVLIAVLPVGALAWALVAADDELTTDADTGVPAYMVQKSTTGPEHGILVLRGDVDRGLTYTVQRGQGTTLGEDEILAHAAEDPGFSETVAALTSRPTSDEVSDLAEHGIEYVVLLAPADGRVAAGLDATVGLTQASAENRETRAWQVDRELPPDAVDGPGAWWRPLLLVVSGLGVLGALVMCVPTLRRRQS